MADMHHYVTAISKVVSTEHEEEVILRGHRLSDLIREKTYAESVFLMLAGRLPSAGEARTLDALMTACVDHGVTPAAMIGRAFASYGTSIPQAKAGGILLFGDIAGGAGDPLARLMKAGLLRVRPDRTTSWLNAPRRTVSASGDRVHGSPQPPRSSSCSLAPVW